MADQDNEKKAEPVKAEPEKKVEAPETSSKQAPASTSGKSGGSKVLIIVIIVVIVLAIIGIVAGRYVSNYIAKRAGEKLASSVLSNALGGKANVSSGGNGIDVTTDEGTLSVGDKAKWPSDMPSNVPEFKYGTINFATKANNGSTSDS